MGRKKKDKFDDAAYIAHLEKTLPQEEKDSPLFLAYKASVKPEKERTQKERINLKIFELAFSLSDTLLEVDDTNTVRIKKFESKAEPELNAVFDMLYPEMLKKWEDRKK